MRNRAVHAARRWVLEAGAIVPGTAEADKFGTFGARSYFSYPPAAVYGHRAIHIGEDTLIGAGSNLIVGYSPDEVDLPARGLVIGDRCVIGAMATLTAHESITIGDDVWFGRNVFVSDASHGYQDPSTPIGQQLGPKQPVSIGSGSWLGHGAIVLPGAQIGRNVVVGAGSVVRGEIPDHAVIAGVPAKVVRVLEPGVGWLATSGSGDLRPTWTTEEVEAMLAGEIPPLF
ncbi:acyltransferase [Nocardioides marmoriginsengisoli]|uniref:Acyltransferase n=1 Tax=Nocardioides marmoriginsengisoli TaxID=661483 RepID=A0A3N0CNB8_9ACTN|nr:acyltransferase [Nocardioides marmoriginsengisoli]